MSPSWVENDRKREGQGSWKNERKSLGTTYCYQGEERRQDGEREEGIIGTSREEGGEKGGKGDIGRNPYKGKGSSIFLCTKVFYN